MKVKLAVLVGAFEGLVELAAEDATQYFDGKKEVVAGFDPARAVGRESTGGNYTMNMWVKFEFLTPGMQNTEEADFCTEMLGIASDFEKRFGTGAKQEIVDELLVLQSQRR